MEMQIKKPPHDAEALWHINKIMVLMVVIMPLIITRFACLTAGFAAGGFIKFFFGIEFLFTCGENELRATVFANQRFVFVHAFVTPSEI